MADDRVRGGFDRHVVFHGGHVAGLDFVVGVAVVGVVAPDTVAVLEDVDAEELVVLLELPHPASTNSPATKAKIETVGIERLFVAPERVATAPTVLSLISQILPVDRQPLSGSWLGLGVDNHVDDVRYLLA